jgi:hypothetical protein
MNETVLIKIEVNFMKKVESKLNQTWRIERYLIVLQAS